MKKVLTSILLLFNLSVLVGQKPIVIRFDKKFPTDQTVEVYQYYKGKTILAKEFKSSGKDSLELIPGSQPGLYLIGLKGFGNRAEFIYNPKESIIIETDMEHLANGEVVILNSPENIAYYDLVTINGAYDHALDSIQMVRQTLDLYQPNYYTQSVQLDSVYEVYAREKNGRLTYLQFNYPGSYTVQFLAPLGLVPIAAPADYANYQTPYAYINKFYLKYVQPSSELLNHYALDDKIMRWVTQFSAPHEDAVKVTIDSIKHQLAVDSTVGNYINQLLVKVFVDAKNPELAIYVMGQDGEGCNFDLGEDAALYLSNYSHVQIGNQVDDIVLNDINGQPVSLSNTCKTTDYTVVVFWISWCVHCQKHLPELSANLLQFKKKVKVFAVSLDEERGNWEAAVKESGLNGWINVSELKPISKSSLAPRFLVSHTPTIYLLDKDRKIIAKNLTEDELIKKLNALIQ